MTIKRVSRALKDLLPKSLVDLYEEGMTKKDYRKWGKSGKPIPPPHAVKKIVIREYQQKSNYRILVETGTYHGDMVFAQINFFNSVYSIELSDYFYDRAVKRFRKYKNVHILHGDSAIVLGSVLKNISEPALFWLDGHYSGGKTAKAETECPIWAEFNQITAQQLPHILLIDDARFFVGEQDYPTIEELQNYFINKNLNHTFEVKDDIIRIALKNGE